LRSKIKEKFNALKPKEMAEFRLIKMLRKMHEANRQKALMTLELLTENPAGIGDHSTEDFYKNADEAIRSLAESEDVLETIKRHYPE
jgi:flagellar motor component MotA